MRRSTSAVLVAVLLVAMGAPAPVRAQLVETVPVAKAEAIEANVARAVEGAARVVALVNAASNDPRMRQARTPEQFSVILEQKAPEIAAARAEIQAISARLSAIPSVASPGDPAMVRQGDQTVDDVAAFALNADALLGKFDALRLALRSADQQRIQASAGALSEGIVVILDSQALMFRAALINFPEGSVDYARNASLACYYDGIASFQRGALGIQSRTDMNARMKASAECLRVHAGMGREALAREEARPEADADLRRVKARLRPLSRRLLEATATAAPLLDRAAEDLVAAPAGTPLMPRYLPQFMAVERQIMEIQAEEDLVLASQ